MIDDSSRVTMAWAATSVPSIVPETPTLASSASKHWRNPVEDMNVNRRHLITCCAILAACCLASGSRALGQVKLDKTQLEQVEALERQVLYYPHLYGADRLKQFQRRGGRRIDYTTPQGSQTAWLIPQAQGPTPERLWVFFAGNGSLGLDLEPVARAAGFNADAFLFVDYPGYGGLCSGKPSPKSIRENARESILAAAKQTNIDPAGLPDRVCVFGHSLGCAAALLAVEELHLRSAVLCAPFTSTADVAASPVRHSKYISLPALVRQSRRPARVGEEPRSGVDHPRR